jgi:hypothetical protein
MSASNPSTNRLNCQLKPSWPPPMAAAPVVPPNPTFGIATGPVGNDEKPNGSELTEAQSAPKLPPT